MGNCTFNLAAKMKTIAFLFSVSLGGTITAQVVVDIGGVQVPVHVQHYSIKYVESEMEGMLLGIHVEPNGGDSFPYYPGSFEGDTLVRTHTHASRGLVEDINTGELSYSNDVHVDSMVECEDFLGTVSRDSLIRLLEEKSLVKPPGLPLSDCRLRTAFITDTLNTITTTATEWHRVRSMINHLGSGSYFAVLAIDCNDQVKGWEVQGRGIFWRIE